MRILGLDYGSVTVGVAVSDALRVTAQPLETITRKDENKLRQTCARIEQLIAEYEVTEWMNKAYRGSDQGRVCMPDLPARVRGLVRTVPLGSGSSNETDSEDKEE